jgi:hypothetical protein
MYEVTLGPGAVRILLRLGDWEELAEALRTELVDGPNAGTELRFDADGNAEVHVASHGPGCVIYTATPLSCDGYTALHRPMTKEELERLSREVEGPVADRGFYVVDILPAESGFTRGPRRV